MSDQPSFTRCPYCRRKLDKTPKRKSKCPHCSEMIYVRKGDLLREDELEASSTKPSAKKPAGKKPAAKKPAAKKPTAKKSAGKQGASKKDSATQKAKPKKPSTQGQLASDMKRKKKETYGADDLLAGLQLLLKVAGAVIAGGGLTAMLSGLFGGQQQEAMRSAGLAGIVQGMDTEQLLTAASEAYTSLDEQERFQMRAVVAWVQNGFRLPDEEGDPTGT